MREVALLQDLVIVLERRSLLSQCSDVWAFRHERLFINPIRKQTEDYITGRFG